nr:E3 ubiquitin-protein ligase UPL3-like [Tanacetum cinerariifolium]
RWQTGQENESRRQRDERPFLGRVQRQKVRISRSRILESAIKVMELYGNSSSVLEVEYFEEVGTGLGPTLEFYSTVSKEFSKKKTKLWRETRIIDVSFNPTFFRVGEASTTVTPSLGAVAAVDADLAKSLKILRKYVKAKERIDANDDLTSTQKAEKLDQIRINDAKIEDLALDFTLPGHPQIELLPNGAAINVT